MHLICIKLMTLLLPLTLIRLTHESILPSTITDISSSHHHGSPSAFHDKSTSQSSLPSSPSSSASSSSNLISSASSYLPVASAEFESSDVSSSFNGESASNSNSNNYHNDRFHLLNIQESHNSQSIPATINSNHNNNQQQSARSSILLPKIYPSPSVMTAPFTSSIPYPYYSSNSPLESKSLDYATTLIKEVVDGPMMHDSNGDSGEQGESSPLPVSASSDAESDLDHPHGREGILVPPNHPPEFHPHPDGEGGKRVDWVISESDPSQGEDTNQVKQLNDDELFSEVQSLISQIRESADHLDEKGSPAKSRNSRNRLTHQMDVLQKLLNDYRKKQGSSPMRIWVRGVSPPRLSVTSPIAVLRDALMEELKRKKMQETQAKIAMNEKILKEVG